MCHSRLSPRKDWRVFETEIRGLSEMIRDDNGPEFISHKLNIWCRGNQVKLVFIQPGRLMQNAFIEKCKGSIRRELLHAYII